jgi:hypothetical protein
MVGAVLHPATGNAITVRQKTLEAQRRRPAQGHLPLSTAVNLTDLELDSKLIRILPTRADSNRSPPDPNRFKKSRSKSGAIRWKIGLGVCR